MTYTKASGTIRALEILLGLTAIIIGAIVLFFPSLAIVSVTFMLAIALLLVGLFRFFWGLAARGVSGGVRGAAILIGIIAVAIAILIMFYPVFATATAVIFIAFGVLIYGIGRIAVGITAHNETGGMRGLQVFAGLLMLGIGTVVLIYPGLGIAFLGILLGIAFLFIGFEGLVAGIVGMRYIPKVPESVKLEP